MSDFTDEKKSTQNMTIIVVKSNSHFYDIILVRRLSISCPRKTKKTWHFYRQWNFSNKLSFVCLLLLLFLLMYLRNMPQNEAISSRSSFSMSIAFRIFLFMTLHLKMNKVILRVVNLISTSGYYLALSFSLSLFLFFLSLGISFHFPIFPLCKEKKFLSLFGQRDEHLKIRTFRLLKRKEKKKN